MTIFSRKSADPEPITATLTTVQAVAAFMLQDAVAAVDYECADPNRAHLFEGVKVNDRPALAKLMIEYASFNKRLRQHNTASNYFVDRQRQR